MEVGKAQPGLPLPCRNVSSVGSCWQQDCSVLPLTLPAAHIFGEWPSAHCPGPISARAGLVEAVCYPSVHPSTSRSAVRRFLLRGGCGPTPPPPAAEPIIQAWSASRFPPTPAAWRDVLAPLTLKSPLARGNAGRQKVLEVWKSFGSCSALQRRLQWVVAGMSSAGLLRGTPISLSGTTVRLWHSCGASNPHPALATACPGG